MNIRKWIDTPDVKEYEKFVNDWHYFLKDLEKGLEENGNPDVRKTVDMYVLKQCRLTKIVNGSSAEELIRQFR